MSGHGSELVTLLRLFLRLDAEERTRALAVLAAAHRSGAIVSEPSSPSVLPEAPKTSAERQRRYREKRHSVTSPVTSPVTRVTSLGDVTRYVTPSLSDSPSRDLSLSDSPDSEQIRERDESVTDGGAAVPAPAALALPAPVTHGAYPADVIALQWAYEGAIARATGGTFGLRVTRRDGVSELDELLNALRAHGVTASGRPLTPPERAPWLAHVARELVAHVKSLPAEERRFWSYTPASLVRFLRDNPVGDGGGEAKSETRIAAGAVAAMTAGIGKGGGA